MPPSTVKDIAPPEDPTAVAGKGFAVGALRFGSISVMTHLLLTPFHPVYRNLTVQFKIYIQMSAMILGGCIFAEKRVYEYNDMVRRRNRAIERSHRIWSEERGMREAYERREMEAAVAGSGSKN